MERTQKKEVERDGEEWSAAEVAAVSAVGLDLTSGAMADSASSAEMVDFVFAAAFAAAFVFLVEVADSVALAAWSLLAAFHPW
jgi:hypothetical protein